MGWMGNLEVRLECLTSSMKGKWRGGIGCEAKMNECSGMDEAGQQKGNAGGGLTVEA